jgi:hypothetical protein
MDDEKVTARWKDDDGYDNEFVLKDGRLFFQTNNPEIAKCIDQINEEDHERQEGEEGSRQPAKR